jgi:sporulation protein YlmC with PRC-barrel domain/ribosomal protein L40E
LLIRKEKIIGLQVYDKKGKFVGTVKDIGFVLGENLVGIVVVGKDNREMEFIWSEVDAVEDIVILKKEVTIPTVTPVPKKATGEVREETKPALREQPVMSPTIQVEKPRPVEAVGGAEVQIAPKSESGGTSEIQASFKEEASYGIVPEEEAEGISLQPSFETSRVEGAASNTKTCPKCGAINNARYKFCFRCGTRLS